MKKSLIPFIAFIFVALFAVAAAAQGNTPPPPSPDKPKADETKKEEGSPLLTKWDVVFAAPGQDYAGTLKLEKEKDAYKGIVATELGESPLRNVKVTGATFTADITVNAQGQSFEGSISGKIADGKLTGDLTLAALGAIPYNGKKSK